MSRTSVRLYLRYPWFALNARRTLKLCCAKDWRHERAAVRRGTATPENADELEAKEQLWKKEDRIVALANASVIRLVRKLALASSVFWRIHHVGAAPGTPVAGYRLKLRAENERLGTLPVP